MPKPEDDILIDDLLRDASLATRERWKTLALDYFPWRAAGYLAIELGLDNPSSPWRRAAHQWARIAAKQGDPDAHAYLAERGLQNKLQRLIDRGRTAAEAGNPISSALVAGLLANSQPAEALEWDSQSGEHGRLFWRSDELREGGIAVYVAAAREEFRLAAEKGYPFAIERAGDGAISRGDRREAISLYTRAATLGRPAAMYDLFEIYRSQNHTVALALEWLTKSANAGYPTAMVVLGRHLADNDWPQAKRWLTRADELGNRIAAKVLKDLTQARLK